MAACYLSCERSKRVDGAADAYAGDAESSGIVQPALVHAEVHPGHHPRERDDRMVSAPSDDDAAAPFAEHGDAGHGNTGRCHLAHPFREILQTPHLDLAAEVGGCPELVEAADRTGELKVRGGV